MVSPILVAYFDKLKCTNLIQLSINIDGLPITKNSKSTLWPILISFVNIVDLKHIVLPVGIYHGKFKKPDSIFDFLNNFMVEMKNILTQGLCVNNVTFKFEISQVVCDAPAKAFILNVKSHNAYNSCNSCIEEGEFINNRMSYLGISAALRTDESFRNKKDENYHKGESPLESFPINIISTVVMDYMHNVCLGVMKRMLLFWVKGKKPVRFLNNNIELEISNQLIEFKPFFPSEFNRLPRSLEELEYWKATEFRSFLLYTGPIVLKGRLQKNFYQHFMLLHCGIRLLLNSETCIIYNDLANDILKQFVTQYPNLYGNEYVTYNVHGLIHLSDFVKIHGSLENFSAFKYENCLQIMKKTVKNSKYPLQDVYNRIVEQYSQVQLLPTYPILKNQIDYNPLIHNDPTVTLYKELITSNFTVSSNNVRNNYFYLNTNNIVSIKKIIKRLDGTIVLEVNQFNNIYKMFEKPIPSNIVGSYFIDLKSETGPFHIELQTLKYKGIFLQIAQFKAVFMLLQHTV